MAILAWVVTSFPFLMSFMGDLFQYSVVSYMIYSILASFHGWEILFLIYLRHQASGLKLGIRNLMLHILGPFSGNIVSIMLIHVRKSSADTGLALNTTAGVVFSDSFQRMRWKQNNLFVGFCICFVCCFSLEPIRRHERKKRGAKPRRSHFPSHIGLQPILEWLRLETRKSGKKPAPTTGGMMRPLASVATCRTTLRFPYVLLGGVFCFRRVRR